MQFRLFLIFAMAFCARLNALTLSAKAVESELNAADLVADIRVHEKQAVVDPRFFVQWQVRAEVLRVHRVRAGLVGRSLIQIEGQGGELGQWGVRYSGFPQPFKGQSYRAHLNEISSGRYEVAGFEFGLEPLEASRTFSRNRTDGSDGTGSGPFLRWMDQAFPLPYFVSLPTFAERPNFVQAVDKSFKTWSEIQGSDVEFLALGCSRGSENANDGINQIIFEDTDWNFGPTVIAITRNFFVSGDSPQAGIILDSDVLINGVHHPFATNGEAGSHDMQNILTHEIGHMLGLGHEINPAQDTDATMFATAALGETKKRSLETSDLDGLKAGYAGSRPKWGGTGLSCNVNGLPAACASQNGCPSPAAPGWIVAILIIYSMRFLRKIPRLTLKS